VAESQPGLTLTVSGFHGMMRAGWEGDPPLVAVAIVRHRVVGVLDLTLPPWDNLTLGVADICVDPAYRRLGIGRALYETAVVRVREAGRTTVIADARIGSAGEKFLVAMGLTPEPGEQHRIQDVVSLDWEVLDRAYADAKAHATDYELREISTPAPDDTLDELTAVISSINDAPVDVRHAEPDRVQPARIRANEAGEAALGRVAYRIVAVHVPTGRFAGYTAVGVDVERPWCASQYATTVIAAHRGHRLGLLLKIEMLRLLRDREPALREISTWNSRHNAHMIAVNEALGYRLVADLCSATATV
jgi:GNAT superfamily N-acetyltransferase